MELKHLRTFVCTVEQASFTQAAAELSITQAAVSQHVSALEKELETRLFDRQGRAIRLTASGQRLHDYARRILDLADQAISELKGVKHQISGTLRIAASTVPAESLLPDLLAQFHEKFPDVHEALTVSDSGTAAAAVADGTADVGFVGELPDSSHLTARAIASDQLILVMAPQHAWARKRSISVPQLVKESFVLRERDSGSRHCLERALAAHGVRVADLTVGLEVNSNDAIRAAVAGGVGVALLSDKSVDRDLKEKRLATTRVRGLKLQRKLYLITRQEPIGCEALREFLRFV